MASGDLTVNKLINRLSVLKNNDNQNESKIELLEKDINLLSERVNEIYYTSREGYLYTFTPEELSNSDIKLSDQNFPKYVVDVYYRTIFFKGLNNSNRSTKYLIFIPRKNDSKDFIIEHVSNLYNRDLSIDSLWIFARSVVSSTTGNTFIYMLIPGMDVYGNNNRKPGTHISDNYIIPIIEKEIDRGSNIRVHAYSEGSNYIYNQDNTLNYIADNYNLKEIIATTPVYDYFFLKQIGDILKSKQGPLKIEDIVILILNTHRSINLASGASPEDANKQVLLTSTLTLLFQSIFNSASLPVKYWKTDFIQLLSSYANEENFAIELRRLLGIKTGEEPIESLNLNRCFHSDELDNNELKQIVTVFNKFNSFPDNYKHPDTNSTVIHMYNDEILPYVACDSEGNIVAFNSNPEGTKNSFASRLEIRFGIVSRIINDDTLNDYQRTLYNRYKNESVHSYITLLIALNYIIDSSE